MRTKWLLLALPLAILALLLQSSFWVPTFASQGEGNPSRLVTFVRAQVGEVKYLNPAVSADYDAGQLMADNLFEGLVWADENLKLAPKLAERWEISEQAYVAVLPERRLGDRPATAERLLAAIEAARQTGLPEDLRSSILEVTLVPGEKRPASVTVLIKNDKGKEEPVDVELSVDVPERVRLRLSKVEPSLFDELGKLLGRDYFQKLDSEQRFQLKKPELLGAARPKLAELLEVGEHNPVLTFHLRAGVRWHDGVPFTADDVKFNYEALFDPKNASPYAGMFEPIKSVAVKDPLTVEITYKRLYSPAVIDWTQPLVPKHLLDAEALAREAARRHLPPAEAAKLSLRSTDFNRNPVGTGPFRFASWSPGQFIHLEQSPQYWGEKAQYHDYFFRSIPDYLTMEVEFGAGAVDLYMAQPHQARRYRADPRYQVLAENDGVYTYIGYNERRPLFQDARVRRALGMAIDVDSIIQNVLFGEGKRATGPYYSNTPYYDASIQPLPYDPKGAVALLESAGFHRNAAGKLEKDGVPLAFTLVTNAGNNQRKAVMTIAQEAWRRLGIDVKIQEFEWTVFLEEFVETNNFDAIVLAWGGGGMNPDMYTIWHSSQSHHYEQNHVGYQSAEADALIAKIRATYDQEEIVRLTHRLHAVVAADQPYTFLYEPIRPVVIDRRVARVRREPDGSESLEKLRTPPSGEVFHFFREWRKQKSVPENLR